MFLEPVRVFVSRLLAGGVCVACLACEVVVFSSPRPAYRAPAARVRPLDFGTILVEPIAAGDTVSEIAERLHMGADVIVALNALRDPYLIRAGGGLKVPANPPWTDGLPAYRPVGRAHAAPARCADKPWPLLETAPTPCAQEACAEALRPRSSPLRVCLCLGEDSGRVTVRAGTELRASWELPLWLGDLTAFDVRQADLDGDAFPELVVAVRTDPGRGIHGSLWSLAILEGGLLAARARSESVPPVPPLLIDVEDYGPGALVARAGEAACDVLASEWRWAHDPLRGTGLYFTGRIYRYEAGALVSAGPGVRMRRDDGMFPWGDDGEAPGRWLREVEVWAHEALFGGDVVVATSVGTVLDAVGVVEEGAGPALRLLVQWDDGSIGYVAWPVVLESEELPHRELVDLGDATTGALWPSGYVPADPRRLVGRALRHVSTTNADDGDSSVTWIGPAPSRAAP